MDQDDNQISKDSNGLMSSESTTDEFSVGLARLDYHITHIIDKRKGIKMDTTSHAKEMLELNEQYKRSQNRIKELEDMIELKKSKKMEQDDNQISKDSNGLMSSKSTTDEVSVGLARLDYHITHIIDMRKKIKMDTSSHAKEMLELNEQYKRSQNRIKELEDMIELKKSKNNIPRSVNKHHKK